jgi:hypothetical protein
VLRQLLPSPARLRLPRLGLARLARLVGRHAPCAGIRGLLDAAALRLVRIVPTPAPVSLGG